MPDEDKDDRRADLEAAFEKASQSEAAPSVEAPADPPAEAAPAEEPAPIVEPADRSRDEKGRFVPAAASKGNEAPRAADTGAQDGVAAPPVAAVIGTPVTPPASVSEPWQRAPQSLKPEAREDWSKVPAPLQQEWHRREREMSVTLQKAAETTRAAEPLMKLVQPYAQSIQQRGGSVEQILGNMLRTEAALSNPDEKARAAILAQAMRTYRVGEEAFVEAYTKGAQPLDPQAMTDQVWAQIQQRQQEEEQRKQHAAIDAAVETFSGNHEFVKGEGGVEPVMVAFLRQGIAKDFQQAYDMACWADPRIRGILQQREASKKAATNVQATQRAHAAASSIKSTPGGPKNGAAPESIREALEAAWDKAAAG